jgi:acetyltransferase-like isoleucine patch superfamily enzyme
MSYYSIKELTTLGLKKFGSNVKISRYARIYNPGSISIGNNVRIDDFSLLSGGKAPFILEDYIHIAAGVYIWGGEGFHMKSFTGLASNCKVYTKSDSYCGNYLFGPSVPEKLRKIYGMPLIIEKYSIIGAGTIILPGSIIGEGVAIGSNSLVTKECKPWNIYAGSPAKLIKERSKKLLELEKELL